jgi:2-methylcitrate dehydratase PrpD
LTKKGVEMGATNQLAEFVVNIGYKDCPEDTVKVAKDFILDCLAVMIGGAKERVSQIAIRYVKDGGGVPECGVFGGGFQTSLINAVFINGTSAHAQELEAVGLYAGSNPMTNIPVALAIAEKLKLSGKDIIEGVITGFEVQAKLGRGCPGAFDQGFSSMPLFGTLGAAATAGKMMKLSIPEMQNALGIGIAQCSGQGRHQATMTHLLENGLGCRNGVTAAMLAREGLTTDPNLIEGERGFCELFSSAGRGYDLEPVLAGLGKPFSMTSPGIFIKKYGCCIFNHRGLDAILQLIEENDIHYDHVKAVEAEVPTFIAQILRFPDPKNGEEAKFSLHQSLASALIDRKAAHPYLRPFSDAGVVDPRYQEARKKVKMITRTDWSGGRSAPWSMPVTVILKDGRKFTKAVDQIKAGPGNPLTNKELADRYRALVQGFLSAEQTERSMDLVFNLEKLESPLELVKIATYGDELRVNRRGN